FRSVELYGRDEVPLKEYLEKKPLPERLAPKLLDIGRYKQLRIEEVLNAVEEGDYIAREDIDRHFLIPDGSIVKGIAPTEKYRFRRYERITPIAAKDRISCWSCDLSCAGKENGNCPGRTEFFKKMGLSESGGFLTASRLPERSV
ncbi:MAG: hypothetical protein PHO30_06765, partial [Candidatus Omnitrophica bacterium]|nr:hypothetical protein [Candidatus Omnitrophota bacterium]